MAIFLDKLFVSFLVLYSQIIVVLVLALIYKVAAEFLPLEIFIHPCIHLCILFFPFEFVFVTMLPEIMHLDPFFFLSFILFG